MPERLDMDLLRERLHVLLGARGVQSSAELQQALGVSQSSISRLIRGDARIARIGRARATRYGLRAESLQRALGTVPVELPLFRIVEDGAAERIGSLERLDSDQVVVRDARHRALDVVDDLPWFLQDLRPEGFLGRLVPRRHPGLGAPVDVLRWSADHVLAYLALLGGDLPGDLVVGEAALQRALQGPDRIIEEGERGSAYARIADDVLHHGAPGSSAAGEQPKLLATVRRDSGVQPVLVKFRPRGDDPVRTRQVDLLLCEHLALQTLREGGVPAARSEVLVGSRRACLQVDRFDRTAAGGRRATVSLRVLDGAFVGLGSDPVAVVDALVRAGRLPGACGPAIRLLHAYGQLIGNSDMHTGNFSAWRVPELVPSGLAATGLTPAYDMLPMALAPRGGELVEGWTPPPPRPWPEWRPAWQLARTFWQRVADEARVSSAFRERARQIAGALERQAAMIARLP